MSKRKTYGEIAYNADCASYKDSVLCSPWKSVPKHRQKAYERAAKAVLRAYDRRKKYIIKTLDAMQ